MRETKPGLEWQSKAILLIVVPWTAISVLLQSLWWAREAPVVMWTTLGISAVFGLIVWRMRAGTLAAAATGAAITASLMYATTRYPYERSWLHGGLMPLLAVFAQIAHGLRTQPHQIAHRLVCLVRHSHRGQLSGPQRLRQHHRVPPVGLHPGAPPRLREGGLLRRISAGATTSPRCPSRVNSRCTP